MKKITIIMFLFIAAVFAGNINSCSTASDLVAAKSGVQLWGENCIRCHNPPSPETFSDTEWDVALIHMRVRANLTEQESELILAFLKSAN